ncbi:MAG TPA: MFS transporter [Candidatus Dormibacteraeota bacterium]|jgi:MFS family permease
MSAVVHRGRGGTFASVRRHRNYRLWFFGQVVSVTGTWVQNVAQAWLVLQLTHSAGAVGVLAACQFGPFAVLGLLGGVISDRLDNRRTLVATQAASMLCATLLAVLALTHVAVVWEVDAVAALSGLVMVMDTPSRQAFTMQMVGRRELPNAIALNSSLFNASRIMGPALGGLIIASAGVGLCFLINAGSYLAVLAALLLMRREELHPVARSETRTSVLRGLREGLAYAWVTPPVLLVLLIMLAVATVSINFNVLLPVLASHTLHAGPEVFGALSAAFGAGALAGALLSATRGRASWPVLLGGAATLGAGELLLAPQRSLIPAAIILAVIGVAFSLFTSNSNATLQLVVPDHLRGRLLSLYAYVFFGTAPLGGVLTGWLSQRGTTPALLAAGGTAVAAAAAGTLVWRRVLAPGRRARSRPVPEPAGEVPSLIA